jgi:hypothetical protein
MNNKKKKRRGKLRQTLSELCFCTTTKIPAGEDNKWYDSDLEIILPNILFVNVIQ